GPARFGEGARLRRLCRGGGARCGTLRGAAAPQAQQSGRAPMMRSGGGGTFRVAWRRGMAVPEGPTPTPRILIGGLVRFALAAVVVEAALIVLAAAGMPIVGIVVMFLAGVPIGLWAARRIPALRFPAILLMPALAAFSVWLIHEPPFG